MVSWGGKKKDLSEQIDMLIQKVEELLTSKSESIADVETKKQQEETTEATRRSAAPADEEGTLSAQEQALLQKEKELQAKEAALKEKEAALAEQANLLQAKAEELKLWREDQEKKTAENASAAEGMENALRNLQDTLAAENTALVGVLDKMEERMQRRDADIQAYQEDYYKKSVTPYIRQFIALADMMRKVVNEHVDDSFQRDEAYWHAQFGKAIESINYILRDFSFLSYEDGVCGGEFNPERQSVVAYQETDDPALDKKISRSLNPGYIWTIPYIIRCKANGEPLPLKAYEIIFRKEQVETFKLK